jgi:dTMP kinase
VEGTPLRILLIGIDGSGKSTAARALSHALLARGQQAVMLRTPGGRRTMTAWWSALRWAPGPGLQDLLESVVRVYNLLANEVRMRRFDGVVILDRGLECQLALREARGLRRGTALPWLQRLLPAPDAVVHFDLPVEVALARIDARGTDAETVEGLGALADAYRRSPDVASFTVLDADRSPRHILDDLLALTDRSGPTPQGHRRTVLQN